ncbi:MAG: VWA domain-containing protein [Bryobacteraceae bacterium]|nr:VWA domain-containing protein [Bryobacteraceae bacterium]
MPRRFSSSRRSVSIPVNARTSVVLPWSTWPAVPTITLLFISILSVSPYWASAQTPESTDLTFQSGVSNVRIDVQVTEQDGSLVTGLTKEDFAIFDEGKPQPILYFGREAEPLSLLLLVDVSGSTRQFVEQIATVARDSLRYLQPKDRVAVMLFARRSRVALQWTDDRGAVASELKRAAGLDPTLGAGTSINEALIDAAKYVDSSAGETGRRAVLILTDNLGLNYKNPDPPVVAAFTAADTVLNAIVVGKGRRPEAVSGNMYQNPDFTSPDVFGLSEATGGEAVKAERAAQAFGRMIERIRTRYSLHYNKPEGAAPGFRRVEVMLSPTARQRHAQAVLRYRKGYRIQ